MNYQNTLILKELGLQEHEAMVYIELLQLGSSPASVLAKETGLKRTTVYPILKELTRKGFVSLFYKNSKRLYRAQQPQKISSYYERKLEAFNGIIPVLKSLEKKQVQGMGLRFIETLDELKQFYGEVLSEYKGKEYYIIGSANSWEGLEPEFFIQFRKDRAKNKIRTKLLLSDESRLVSPNDLSLLREVTFLPKGYGFKSTIDIYKDQVLIISPDLASLAVVIAVPVMVDVFRSVFDILWDSLTIKKLPSSRHYA
jgi:sugar-specific transcriptional regulator TrmB